jgi:phosphoglycolate phosphatase
MANIFFDLDGTWLDSKNRLYQLFQFLISPSGLSFDDYWELKQNKISHEEILQKKFNYNSEQIIAFNAEWMKRIELPEWLKLDTPAKGLKTFLESLSNYELHVVTARQNKQAAIGQLESFGLATYFKNILVTEQKMDKEELITNFVVCTPNDWIVGDTGKDIEIGKKLGLRTAAVLSGFLNRNKLSEYKPDVILTTVTDLKPEFK